MTELIIDAHLHVFSDDLETYPYQPGARAIPSFAATAEHFSGLMAENNIEHAVLVQPSAYMYDHRYLTGVLQRYQDKFAGVCLVDPLAPDAVAQLRRKVEEGYRGLRLNPLGRGEDSLDNPILHPLWEEAERLGVIISMLILPDQIDRLAPMVARYPNVTVVIDHMGRAKGADGYPYPSFQPTLRLAKYPNTYLKVSGFPVSSSQSYPYEDVLPMVEMALEAFGAQRLMWATDYPWIVNQCGYKECLAIVYNNMPFLNEDDRTQLLGGTCRKLFFKG